MKDLIKSLAVTAEVLGMDWSEAAAEMIAEELRQYPLALVQQALRRCVNECKGKLALSDILQRIPGAPPGAEEAWAIVSRGMKNEALTIVWTDEIREAYGVALGVEDDPVGARMAFKEYYVNAVNRARNERRAPVWSVSQGTDKADRERAIIEGVKQGRLTQEYAQRLLPSPNDLQALELLGKYAPKLLGGMS